MRPLNRPMFRYGGPIKEGVMSGIREPKRNGGMLLVGQHPDRFKDASGREKHLAPVIGIGAGLARVLPWAARGARAAWRYMKPTSVPRNIVTKQDSKLPIGMRGSIKDRINITPRSNWQMAKNWMRANPGWTATGILSAYNAPGTYETGKGAAGLAWKGIKQIGDLAVPDWIWDQDKWEKERALKKTLGGVENKISKINQEKAAIGMPENLTYNASAATKKGGGVELSEEEIRKKNVERYRDIMDIKGMNKEAAYDSLIAASKAINETGGDFKQAIKDGSLINRIIQDTSKAFDKPKATKDAIDTLILKGEIQKDINLSDPGKQADIAYKKLATRKIEEELDPSYGTLVAAFSKNLKGQAAYDEAAKEYSSNKGITWRGNLISKSDFKDILTDLKKNPETKDADDRTIIATWTQTQLDESQKNIPDGNYTVGDKVITIKDKTVVDVT